MKRWLSLLGYTILGCGIAISDFVTKQWALTHCKHAVIINDFITCKLSFNRGIAWSLLSFDDQTSFIVVSLIISIVLILFIWHTLVRWRHHQTIIAETMVIAGAAANLLDRYLHASVIDFIWVHYQDIAFPAFFNIADIAITVGVFYMLVSYYYE